MSHQTILNNPKQTMSPLHVASIVYFDVLHLMTERSSHWRHSMFLKNSRFSEENACAGVSAYQFNRQSMGLPDRCRSSHWRCSVKKCVLKIFNKVAANQTCNFAEIRLQQSRFHVKFVKFLRTPILKNI